MYKKELPVGDRVTEEPSSAEDIAHQLSEYDSDFSNEEDSTSHEEDAVEAVPVNSLSKTVRTRTDHALISCSFFIVRYKKLFLFAEAYKNTRKFKISIERINLHLTFISFCRNWTFVM